MIECKKNVISKKVVYLQIIKFYTHEKINFLFTLTFVVMSITVFLQAVEKGVKLIDVYYG